jgi:hypothetical protein
MSYDAPTQKLTCDSSASRTLLGENAFFVNVLGFDFFSFIPGGITVAPRALSILRASGGGILNSTMLVVQFVDDRLHISPQNNTAWDAPEDAIPERAWTSVACFGTDDGVEVYIGGHFKYRFPSATSGDFDANIEVGDSIGEHRIRDVRIYEGNVDMSVVQAAADTVVALPPSGTRYEPVYWARGDSTDGPRPPRRQLGPPTAVHDPRDAN